MPPPSPATVDVKQFIAKMLAGNARRIAESKAPAEPLRMAIENWFESLPAVTRHRRYQLTEISDALFIRTGNRFASRRITAVLESLAWTTRRDWTRAGRNRRYWLPTSPRL